jgi:hypothetical protein
MHMNDSLAWQFIRLLTEPLAEALTFECHKATRVTLAIPIARAR